MAIGISDGGSADDEAAFAAVRLLFGSVAPVSLVALDAASDPLEGVCHSTFKSYLLLLPRLFEETDTGSLIK